MENMNETGLEGGKVDYDKLTEWYNVTFSAGKNWVGMVPVIDLLGFLETDEKHTVFAMNEQTGEHLLLMHTHPPRIVRVSQSTVAKKLNDAQARMDGKELGELREEVPALKHQLNMRDDVIEEKNTLIESLKKKFWFAIDGIIAVAGVTVLAGVGYVMLAKKTPEQPGKAPNDIKKIQDELRFKIGTPYQRAEMLYVHDKAQDALLEINKALDQHVAGKSPDPADQLLILRGLIYDKLGQPHLAIADLEEAGRKMAFKITPEPWRTLQRLYVQTGNTAKARVCRHIVEGIVEEGGRNREVIEADINELLSMKK